MHVGKIDYIPLNKLTAYLTGVVIGDGYIVDCFKGGKTPNSRSYKVEIDSTNFEHLCVIAELTNSVVLTNAKMRALKVGINQQPTWSFSVSNKSWWHFFTSSLQVPCGKKSRKVTVPLQIVNASDEIKKEFVAGVFDTDGGLKGNCIGITTASKMMCDQLALLLENLGFQCRISSWVIEKYNWRYYALNFYRRDIDRFLKEIPLRNERKKAAIAQRFIRGRTEAV